MSLTVNRRIVVPVVIGSAMLIGGGQVLFKTARAVVTDAALLTVLGGVETWAALGVYGASSVCWLWVLSRVPLSFAHPRWSWDLDATVFPFFSISKPWQIWICPSLIRQ